MNREEFGDMERKNEREEKLKTDFRIKMTPGNKTGSLPSHWDIYAPGSTESIATVWDSLALTERIIQSLHISAQLAEHPSALVSPPVDQL